MFVDFLLKVFENNIDKTAMVYKDKEYTYGYLLEEYYNWNRYLKINKIEQNEAVALKSDFNPSSVSLLISLINNKNIIVPLSLNIEDDSEYLKVSEVSYKITIDENITTKYINYEQEHHLFNKLIEKNNSGLVLFSSGTTGKPKGAVHNLDLLLEKFKKSGKVFKTISFLLFDHIGGFNTLFYCLSNGGTLVTVENRTADEVCRVIEKYEVELLPTSPTFLNMILANRSYEKYNLNSLKIVSYGTESMPKSTLDKMNILFPKMSFKQTYGLSELGILSTKSESSNSLWLKIGGEGFKYKIVDDILWIKSTTSMLGYLNAENPFDEQGFFNTKDKVEVKGEYIKFLGRDSDIINVGGLKVYPAEVENVLMEIDEIQDVLVYSEKNHLIGNIVVADILVDCEFRNKEFIYKIKNYCKDKMEKYKIPVKINFSDNSFNGYRFKKNRK
jgi:long-chain acyl-CoA synthetase